jgi:hypothetical protein
MRHAELSTIRESIQQAVRKSALGNRVRDISLEADHDNYGSDFLRVLLELDSLDGVSHENMLALITSIEDSVIDLDERYPSVRFSDAA